MNRVVGSFSFSPEQQKDFSTYATGGEGQQPDAVLCPSSPRLSVEISSPRKTVTRSAAPPPPSPKQKVVVTPVHESSSSSFSSISATTTSITCPSSSSSSATTISITCPSSSSSSSSVATTASEALEVSYFANPTILSRLIHDHQYNDALGRLQECPQEAAVWLVAKREDKSSNKNNKSKKDYWIRTLPIHMACRSLRVVKNDPALVESLNQVIVCLTIAYPWSCREKDHQGMLPLHISILYGASPDTISSFLMADPKSLHSRDCKGCTLIELNNHDSLGHGDDRARQQKVEELLFRPKNYWEQARDKDPDRFKNADLAWEMNDCNNDLEQETRLSRCGVMCTPELTPLDDEVTASEFLEEDDDEDDDDDDDVHDCDEDDVSDTEMPSASGVSETEATEVGDLLCDYVVPVAVVEKLKEKAETCETMLKDMESRNNELLEKNKQLQEGRMRLLGALDRANVTQMAADIARCREENKELKEQLKELKKSMKKTKKKLSSKGKKESSSSNDKPDKSKKSKDKTKDKMAESTSTSKKKSKSTSACESGDSEAMEVNEKEEKKLKKLQRKERKMKLEYREMSLRYKQQSSRLLGLVDTVETLLFDSPVLDEMTRPPDTEAAAPLDDTLKQVGIEPGKATLSVNNNTLAPVSGHAPESLVEEKKRKSKRRSSMGEVSHVGEVDEALYDEEVKRKTPKDEDTEQSKLKPKQRRDSIAPTTNGYQRVDSSKSITHPLSPSPKEKKSKSRSQRRSSMGHIQQVDSSSSIPPPPSPKEKKTRSQRRSSMGNAPAQKVDSSSSGAVPTSPRQQRRSSMGHTESSRLPSRRRGSLATSNSPLQDDQSSDDLLAIFNNAVKQQHETRSPSGKKELCRMKIEPVLSSRFSSF